MGAMTRQTLPLANRQVLHPLTKGLFSLPMTRIAEIATLLLEQTLEFGDMGIMALGAFTLGHRLMNNLAAEFLFGMTADASLRSQGRITK